MRREAELTNWEEATRQQVAIARELGSIGHFEIGIFCHSGGNAEFLGWFSDGASAANAMEKIHCNYGQTAFGQTFGLQKYEERITPTDAAIIIGDCFEEDDGVKREIASSGGVKIFTLQEATEGSSVFSKSFDRAGEEAFKYISRRTGGAYAPLGDPAFLKSFVAAIGAATSGKKAVSKLSEEGKEALRILGKTNKDLLLLAGPSNS